jgi:predicted permease
VTIRWQLGNSSADFRHALRLYAKTPVSSALVIVGLAMTIAIETAFLSLWAVLEFHEPAGFEGRADLITVGQNDGRMFFPISEDLVERVNTDATTIEALAGIAAIRQILDRDEGTEELGTELVTQAYFSDVGPKLLIGRGFTDGDHRADAEPVAVISYALWQRAFGGDEAALDRTLRLRGRSPLTVALSGNGGDTPEVVQDYRIVGVLTPGMRGTFQPEIDVWLPFEQVWPLLAPEQSGPRFPLFRGLARLAPGADAAAASTELNARFGTTAGETLGLPFSRLDVIDGIVRDVAGQREVRRQVQLFLAGSLLLLVTAACNISLFLLSRAPGRRRELAVRMALGAVPRRLARQLVTEAAALVLTAALLGIVASIWLAGLVPKLAFLRRLDWQGVTVLDWRVLAITTGLALLVAVLVALAPIAGIRRLGVDPGGQRTTDRSSWGQRLAGSAQIALAAVVGAAAIAFIWHLRDMSTADRGFDAPDVLLIRMTPPDRFAPPLSPEAATAALEQRRELIESLPGVEAVSFGTAVPGAMSIVMIMPVSVPNDPTETLRLDQYAVDPDYFRMLGMTLLHGRMLEAADDNAVVVNETMARQLWGRSDVTGELVPIATPPRGNGAPPPGANAAPPQLRIVGVIRDVSFQHPSETVPPMAFRRLAGPQTSFSLTLVETTNTPDALRNMLQQRIDAGELDFEIADIRPVETAWNDLLAPDRARTLLTIASAIIVLILAATGYYGTQRYLVAAGRRQFAIVAALGASPQVIFRQVLRRGISFGLPGLIVGVPLAFALVVWLRRDFVAADVSPMLVATMVLAAVLALLLGATSGPAREARATDPARLLREE